MKAAVDGINSWFYCRHSVSRYFQALAVSHVAVVEIAKDNDQLSRGASTGNMLATAGDAYVQACAVGGFMCAPASPISKVKSKAIPVTGLGGL
jgi:hypothetical protein